MRFLIVDDDIVIRMFLEKIFSSYGKCDLAEDGKEAVDAFRLALDQGEPYNLVCLDVMMPRMDGQRALEAIRAMEEERNIEEQSKAKVLMTTALKDPRNVKEAFEAGAEGYLVKPLHKREIVDKLVELFGPSLREYVKKIL